MVAGGVAFPRRDLLEIDFVSIPEESQAIVAHDKGRPPHHGNSVGLSAEPA